MSALERYSPADEHEVEKQPHDVVLTNYDRITQDEGKLAGFERSSAEYEQKGLKGLAQKVRYSFLRQAIIRKNIKEAQRQVKSNTETLLLRSPDVEAAAKGLSIDEKPFIHPDEVNAYRASIALNDEHDERIDSRYAAQQNLLEAQLQNRVNALTMSGDRSRIAAEVSTWVDGAIAQLPQYYRSEDKELFVRQITESVERVMDSYARAVAESGDTDAARKIKLHLAGMEKNGGKSRLRTMAAELATHPLVWTGASIGLKALTFAPVVGGVFYAKRSYERILKRRNRSICTRSKSAPTA